MASTSSSSNTTGLAPDSTTRRRIARKASSGWAAKNDDSESSSKGYRHVAAVHSSTQPSCLSADATSIPSFVGFRNLMAISLVAANFRLMIENIEKYGVLICVRCHDFRQQDVLLGLALYFLIPCHLFLACLIESVAASQATGLRKGVKGGKGGEEAPSREQSAKFRRTWITVAWLHSVNVVATLAYTSYVVYYHIHHPLIGTATELHAIIVLLKTYSYALTNRDLRHAYLHPNTGALDSIPDLYAACPYPRNVTMSNIIYFWWAPTLIYQPVYPRTPRIRWVFVAKRVAEAFFLAVFIWFIAAQYATPLLQNSLIKIHTLEYTAILERLLKLSTISLVIWLAGFFAFFQSTLNALAEITRFGDRSFYDDWWNSENLGVYWRTWNKPVYKYFKRHVFTPLLARGWSPMLASTMVFFLSAVLHEILVGVPTHNIIGVAFLGMFLQLPLIKLTMPLGKSKTAASKLVGNTIFWVSFTIFGQPFAALMYFYAWQV
ncbi:related to diacylglycerol acyltransferase [Cephalotrichum gorgonifer]|uniref:O-acyltransferase n=1 Tax=Cephalotrichum gorgonifer TaxID=2041049 RepID=A0AAE8SU09_9PEZI|nr:related to diacylglycerol acyltransferase [Cephalotrichum gorgonifer]